VTPTSTATTRLDRKVGATSWAQPAGSTISPLISSSPSTRIDSVTVPAVTTASSRSSRSTGSPLAAACSSSRAMVNRYRPSPTVTARTTTAIAVKTTTSDRVVVVSAPNR